MKNKTVRPGKDLAHVKGASGYMHLERFEKQINTAAKTVIHSPDPSKRLY